ncbi:hypothetical protein FQR65_LT11371 [Abscondita terminalis]|nr:hypothetical protein FQR65_LT11371 [Abscondita terminalis]
MLVFLLIQESTVLYLGYGSNLLAERLHRTLNATRDGIGLLKNYRLDFDYYSKRWNGYVATIVPDTDEQLWVAVWKINSSDLTKIDAQEGVDEKIYERIIVNVEKPDGTSVEGYTYMLVNNPTTKIPLYELPQNRKPSKIYLDVIIKGAKESGLPENYQKMLENISNNGYNGNVSYDIH